MTVITTASVEEAFLALIAQFNKASAVPQRRAPDINTTLLADALNYITEHPEEHDQTVWSWRKNDGTVVGCVAYHVARLAGHTIDPLTIRGTDGQSSHVVSAWGPGARTEHNHLAEVARRELRVTLSQATRLFSPFNNNLDKLWAVAGELTGGAVTRANND